ncbi:MAG: SDR family oxidoreductase [Vicinamibacteria bacterium]
MTTLVTGGTGLIGGELLLALASSGQPVAALVRAATPDAARRRLFARLQKSAAWRPELAPSIQPVQGDTTREMFGLEAAQAGRITTVVHCAANTQFAKSEEAGVWDTNVGGARNLVGLARQVGGVRVVFVGTAAVVTAPAGACLDEDAPLAGHANAYTRSKREAEAIVRDGGAGALVLRPSIVLARGVHDRAMARSILWAVPIMGELGEVPVDPGAHVDLVPVDHVVRAIVRLLSKAALRHAVYHISAGAGAHTFARLWDAVARGNPWLPPIRPLGGKALPAARPLLRPLASYLPFVNADVRYSNERLVREIGSDGEPAPALSYVPALVGLISRQEALEEMQRP